MWRPNETPKRRVNLIFRITLGVIFVLLVFLFSFNRKEFGSDAETSLELSISNRLQARTAARDQSREQWRTPIKFYGKVLDNEDRPIEGATVRFSCNDLSSDGVSNYRTQTDPEGLFSITGIEGKVLVVDVSKDGYTNVSEGQNAIFFAGIRNVFTPDISNPVLFTLRKQAKAEPLIFIDYPGIAKIAKLKPDGTPTTINLLGENPEMPSEGRLTLIFRRGEAPKKGKFDYALELSIPGGGLIESEDKLLLDAPDSGYNPVVRLLSVPKENEEWALSLRRKFYIKLPGGIFGRIELSVYAHNGVFTIQSAVNPNGSRNLDGIYSPITP